MSVCDNGLSSRVADFATFKSSDVMIRVNCKESRPLRVGIQGSISTTGDDAGLVVLFHVFSFLGGVD